MGFFLHYNFCFVITNPVIYSTEAKFSTRLSNILVDAKLTWLSEMAHLMVGRGGWFYIGNLLTFVTSFLLCFMNNCSHRTSRYG